MTEEIKHYQMGQRYKVQYERSAVKGVDGFKVEANGDDLTTTTQDAEELYEKAQFVTRPPVTIPAQAEK